MGIFDNLKNRQQNKEELARAESINAEMYSAWNGLIEEYGAGQTSNSFDYMRRMGENGENIIGAVKKGPAPDGGAYMYEFLFVYPQPDGQVLSNYFRMFPMSSFASDRSLGNIKIEYVTNVNGKDVPCTALFQTSTQELLNVRNIHLVPNITPAISSISPNLCNLSGNEFTEILTEFCYRENLMSKHSESMSDNTPGR